jgi:hypothetical protein
MNVDHHAPAVRPSGAPLRCDVPGAVALHLNRGFSAGRLLTAAKSRKTMASLRINRAWLKFGARLGV